MSLPTPGTSIAGQYIYSEVLSGLTGSLILTAIAINVPVTYNGTGGTVTSVSIPSQGILNPAQTIAVTGGFGASEDPTAFTFSTPGLLGIGTQTYIVSNTPIGGLITLGGIVVLSSTGLVPGATNYAACYLAGTRLLTPSGEVRVEDIVAGDMVTTASGAVRPVKWVGQRSYTTAGLNRPEIVIPIRIAGGAIAENVPHRDLLVSPEHAIYIDGVLVPARHLVNGTTIAPDDSFAVVEYFHIELDAHDILVAEGLAAESWLDTGNRGMFANAGDSVTQHPAFASRTAEQAWASDAYAPLVTSGDALANIRQAIVDRAVASGEMTRDPGLHLSVGGVTVEPVSIQGSRYGFRLPAGTRDIAIVSRSVAGSLVLGNPTDQRRLGIALSSIVLSSAAGPRSIGMADPALQKGFSAVEGSEAAAFRWTNGYAILPAFLLTGYEAGFDLVLDVAGTVAYPASASATAEPRLQLVMSR